MTPREYWTACRLHDWFYTYSDDPGVYRAGKEDRNRLMSVANSDEELKAIFLAWQDHHFECGPIPTEPKMED